MELDFADIVSPHPLVRSLRSGHTMTDSGVRVDRATCWGNPYCVSDMMTREDAVRRYLKMILRKPDMIAKVQRELRDKTLWCWCTPKLCHADVLATLANMEVG